MNLTNCIRRSIKSLSPLRGVGGVLLILLASCVDHSHHVRIHGDIAHLGQGQFLIYSSDGAIVGIDTLNVKEGKFYYELPLDREATLHIIYPNDSRLTLFAQGGDELKVKGDATNLSEVSVSGSLDNECYTRFRLETNGLSPARVLDLADSTIRLYPTLAMSRYLLQTRFLEDTLATRAQVDSLYHTMQEAQSGNVALGALATAVAQYRMLAPGTKCPAFSLTLRPAPTSGDTARVITERDLLGHECLIYFWATWRSESSQAPYYARRLRREASSDSVNILSYSLDVSEQALAMAEKRDSITYHSFCDYRAFASPLAQRWGIRDIPYYIYCDSTGQIVASGSDWKHDIEPRLKKKEKK